MEIYTHNLRKMNNNELYKEGVRLVNEISKYRDDQKRKEYVKHCTELLKLVTVEEDNRGIY